MELIEKRSFQAKISNITYPHRYWAHRINFNHLSPTFTPNWRCVKKLHFNEICRRLLPISVSRFHCADPFYYGTLNKRRTVMLTYNFYECEADRFLGLKWASNSFVKNVRLFNVGSCERRKQCSVFYRFRFYFITRRLSCSRSTS